VGSLITGTLKDKFGYKVTLWYLMVISAVLLSMTIANNEVHMFNTWWAYSCMFGLGLIDNGFNSFIEMFLSFEFDTKIAQFAAKHFSQNIMIFLFLIGVVVSDFEMTQTFFRSYLGLSMLVGVLGPIILLRSEWLKEKISIVRIM
jgi:fucose permease